jgi:hypothetical protein
MSFARIPAELRENLGWVVWRWGEVDPKTGRRKKPPYCATDLRRHGSSTNPETWATFEQAVSLVELDAADGIGFALAPPYVGVDLDKELSANEQYAIMLALDSYAERSPSGTGHHVILKADPNGRGRHPVGFGVFQTGRFFYCTGEHVTGMPMTIQERQKALEAVVAEYLPKPNVVTIATYSQRVDLDDQDLIERMFASKSGDKIRRLWDGEWSSYPSQSEADLALLAHLAFWTDRDAGRMEAMFRSSALYREEAPKKPKGIGYLARTIAAAIAGTPEGYQPGHSELSRGSDAVDAVRGFRGEGGENGVAESGLKDSATPDAPTPVKDERLGSGSDSDAVADSVADSERPFALPIQEFVSLEREQREPMLADADGRAVVGFFALVLLAALGGHGKTTWALDLLLHMAAGVNFAPFTVPRPVSILIIERGAGATVRGQAGRSPRALPARAEGAPRRMHVRLGRLLARR